MTKILIVEDDLQISNMYQKKFQIDGWNPILAYDGKQGLDKALVEKPDLILLDIIMPEIDGLTVLKRLKKDPRTKKIPVIMLTVLKDDEKIGRAMKLGAADYLVKSSLTPSQVADKIKNFTLKKNA
jgi:two-component system alkaline phosphatase synthesis response regulator PhoP